MSHKQFTVESASVRRGEWKVIRKGNERARLFDLSVDPAEAHDQSRRNPKEVNALTASLEELRSKKSTLGNAGPDASLSQEQRQRLESLGYAGGP